MKLKLIVFLVVVLSWGGCGAPVKAQEPMEGRWEIEEKSSQIFSGTVRIIYVRSRPGSRYKRLPIIYDEEQAGFLCSPMEGQTFICGAAAIEKKELTADDRADLVTYAVPGLPLFKIKFDFREDKLEISGRPLTAEPCNYSDGCSYEHWVTLKRKQNSVAAGVEEDN